MINYIKRDELFSKALHELTGGKGVDHISSKDDVNRVIFTGLDGSGKSYLCANLVVELNKNISDRDKQVKYLHSGPKQSLLYSIRDPEYMRSLVEARIFDRHPMLDFIVYKVSSEVGGGKDRIYPAIDLAYEMNYFYEIKNYDSVFVLLDDKFVHQTIQPSYVTNKEVRDNIILSYQYVVDKLNKLRPEINIYIVEE